MAKNDFTIRRIVLIILVFITAFFSLVLLAFPLTIFKVLAFLMFWGFILLGIALFKMNMSGGAVMFLCAVMIIIDLIMFSLGVALI